MPSDQEKFDYIKRHFGCDFPQGKHSFTISCDFCGSEILGKVTISRNNRAYKFSLSGASLNLNVPNIRVLCSKCRIALERWGQIQRWLKSINKTEQELPDCSNLEQRRYPP